MWPEWLSPVSIVEEAAGGQSEMSMRYGPGEKAALPAVESKSPWIKPLRYGCQKLLRMGTWFQNPAARGGGVSLHPSVLRESPSPPLSDLPGNRRPQVFSPAKSLINRKGADSVALHFLTLAKVLVICRKQQEAS